MPALTVHGAGSPDVPLAFADALATLVTALLFSDPRNAVVTCIVTSYREAFGIPATSPHSISDVSGLPPKSLCER